MARFALISPSLGDAARLTARDAVAQGFRVAELQSDQPGEVWRSAGSGAQRLRADLDVATAVDTVALLYSNLTATATWRVSAADSARNLLVAPTYDSGERRFNATPPDARGWSHGRLWLPAPVRARYWQILLSDGAQSSGYLQAGRLVMGLAWSPAITIDRDWIIGWVDESLRVRARGGQGYVDPRVAWRRLRVSLSWLTDAEAAALEALVAARLTARPVLAVRAFDVSAWAAGAVYGRLAPPLEPIREPYAGIHRTRLTVEEMLP